MPNAWRTHSFSSNTCFHLQTNMSSMDAIPFGLKMTSIRIITFASFNFYTPDAVHALNNPSQGSQIDDTQIDESAVAKASNNHCNKRFVWALVENRLLLSASLCSLQRAMILDTAMVTYCRWCKRRAKVGV